MGAKLISFAAAAGLLFGTLIFSCTEATARTSTLVEPNIEDIATILRNRGYQATIERPQGFMPRIHSSFAGTATVILAHCSQRGMGPCSSLQFAAELEASEQPLELKDVNKLNDTIGYVKFIKTDNSNIKAVWRVYIEEVSIDYIGAIFGRWEAGLNSYTAYKKNK